ncbi:hypothetical protein [Gracilimonas amylolytica]|nr:hypothetical protein [Gracilimonas amylolytica]
METLRNSIGHPEEPKDLHNSYLATRNHNPIPAGGAGLEGRG